MKTEQEQIEQIEKVLKDSVADYKHLKKKGVCYCYAETLIDKGYGNVSEYKAEIEQLKAENEHRKKQYDNQVAENTLLHIEYDKSFERLKAQQREIDKLKAKNKKYLDSIESVQAGRCRLRCPLTEQAVKQAKIDVLNELKEKCKFDGHTVAVYKNDIEQMIEEIENE